MRARIEARSQSCGHAAQSDRAGPRESSHSINRRRLDQQIQRENAGIAMRISERRLVSCGPGPKKAGDQAVPAGWTRGVGGRLMPPPRLRWGERPSYNAGEWNS